MAGHTPGPWGWCVEHHDPDDTNATWPTGEFWHGPDDTPEKLDLTDPANVRLIAAAPKMLEALKAISGSHERWARDMVSAAIRLAETGEG